MEPIIRCVELHEQSLGDDDDVRIMRSEMQYVFRPILQDELIEKLGICLANGGDVDFLFQVKVFGLEMSILHYFIIKDYAAGVKYALSRGADPSVNMICVRNRSRQCNALELVAEGPNYNEIVICNMLKNRSLELYSTYGLTPLHVDCAFKYCSIEPEENLPAIDVNAFISTESPVWPGINPILIAAKFTNCNLISFLLDLGADPNVRDTEGNTPLHYFSSYLCDKRLFAFDASNTFGPLFGESHFHIACEKCPDTLDIVKRYLDQGISPDLSVQHRGCEFGTDTGSVGLHIAARRRCPELIRLLLDYGATINKKDFRGNTPVDFTYCYSSSEPADTLKTIECMSLFIEAAGSNVGTIIKYSLDRMNDFYIDPAIGQAFLRCIARLTSLNEDLVPEWLMDVYLANLEKCEWWDEAEYVCRCMEELATLSDLGLRNILDSTAVVKSDFEDKFGRINFSNFEAYPIYGSLLKTNTKRKLREFKDRKRRILQAIPQLQSMFQEKCCLPDLCAEAILWNMSNQELDQFVEQN